MIINFIKRRKYLLTFFSVLFIISFIIGIILYNKCNFDINSLDNIKNDLLNNHINNIFNHLLIISSIIILSFTIIGYFSSILLIFYEGMSIGFTFAFLVLKYGLKGLIFGIIYNILFKLMYLILIIYIIIRLFDIVKIFINYLFTKDKFNFKYIKKCLLSIFIIILIVIINDLLIYILSKFLLKILIYML